MDRRRDTKLHDAALHVPGIKVPLLMDSAERSLGQEAQLGEPSGDDQVIASHLSDHGAILTTTKKVFEPMEALGTASIIFSLTAVMAFDSIYY